MIFGNINELETCKPLISQVNEILTFYKKYDVLQIGEWIVLSDALKVIRLNDWNRSSDFFEAHRMNYDLHVTLKGIDRMRACLSTEHLEVVQEYNDEKDFLLYRGKEDGEFFLKEGMWALIAPNEPHRNEFLSEGTEKMVFKIRLD